MIDPKTLTGKELSSKDFSSYDPNAENKVLKVSKSSFIAYDSCPRKYWWEKVQLQDLRLPANEYMIHGSEVHTNLETIYDNWQGQSTLSPLIPAEQYNKSNDNLVFLEECRLEKWGLEHFMPDEYEEYRAVWDEENECVLVGLIDGILIHPEGGLCIYELKTGSWGSTKMSKTRKELCYYKRMLELMGETRPITHFGYIAPDASNDKYVAELCGWKDGNGRWDEDRVATSKAGWLDTNSKRDVAIGRDGQGILILEKVNKRSITSFEKALSQGVAGIKAHDWPMKWNDYFCPAWCDFAMSCESENNGMDNLWEAEEWV